MRDEKALEFFREILKQSRTKSLGWQPTAEPDRFVAPMLGKYTLTLVPYTYDDQWEDLKGEISLILEDQAGNILLKIDNNLEGVTREDLEELLACARRGALNVDAKIDQLLHELQKGGKGF